MNVDVDEMVKHKIVTGLDDLDIMQDLLCSSQIPPYTSGGAGENCKYCNRPGHGASSSVEKPLVDLQLLF